MSNVEEFKRQLYSSLRMKREHLQLLSDDQRKDLLEEERQRITTQHQSIKIMLSYVPPNADYIAIGHRYTG